MKTKKNADGGQPSATDKRDRTMFTVPHCTTIPRPMQETDCSPQAIIEAAEIGMKTAGDDDLWVLHFQAWLTAKRGVQDGC